MNKIVTTQELIYILKKIAHKIEIHEEELTDLDRQIGDGDHGTNLKRGFNELLPILETSSNKTTTELLNACSMTMMSKVGGSSGPLLATAFMRMAKENELNKMLLAAAEGIKMRGKANVGEKTMLDVLEPFATTFDQLTKNGEKNKFALEKALKVAYDSKELVKNKPATKGRASYLGERTIGIVDPGSQSMYYILETLVENYND
ncbi:dihydroxyacetone kinase subunit L [Mycoplasmopsis anatis]|uniref:Dihydroxyacetone kinase subunit L n=1 Tax=Mycoplasmopsis anatis TaxID=171279 RepID=A0A9Q3L984_9BACT|nr:dihydroxyacetone kinase subunit DhaL [Mycoplasmopsis anatis]MBW0594514.1 dihydroxyacetone kinase subunit L [Mycoplasmopsis anatis]MBW0595695.1 dihydroxyacetone kinase subunit L [Mycoplasmopsis anatis]MBW0596137.1 dihydroxyacetone kinase subunit L [Mycoplasmopsis anatis]MBW0596821.1 dihydroxyacetone kinase subunit L [Mycoplasmopsis anatis]MBW0597772.1 dihydroxyacetone kinase subunit L [Mycoplasmopsis anatis]